MHVPRNCKKVRGPPEDWAGRLRRKLPVITKSEVPIKLHFVGPSEFSVGESIYSNPFGI